MTSGAPMPSNGAFGADHARLEGPEKVSGLTRYGADHAPPSVAYLAMSTARIARGRVVEVDRSALTGMAGILCVLTREDIGREVRPGKPPSQGGYLPNPTCPMLSGRVAFAGEPVALVVAETLDAAMAGADAIRVSYESEPAAAGFDSPLAEEVEAEAQAKTSLAVGDVDRAFDAGEVTVDARYSTPAQHHNAMELFQVTCAWDGDRLTIWESTQNVRATQYGVAEQLGIDPDQVCVISSFVGGAFGGRGELGQSTALVALAARRVGRPVKFVATRRQCFTQRTFRAETRHRVRLAADRDGHLAALDHESWELSSRAEPFALAGSDQSARLYACPNIRTKVRCVQTDRQTPAYMRAPPTVPYLFALESAMDELACALGIDPLDLRRRNETATDPIDGKPFTSRGLLRCIEAGAAAFGWSARDPRPGSMRDGDDLIGWGYATSMYPAQIGPAAARVTIDPDLRLLIEIGAHEIGTGVNTIIAQVAADHFGLNVRAIDVRTGDSAQPPAPAAVGSCSSASVLNAVAKACAALSDRLGPVDRGPDALAAAVRRAGSGQSVTGEAANLPDGAPADGLAKVGRGKPVLNGGAGRKDNLQFSFGAQFVEVRVDRWTAEVRASRLIGTYAAGRIVNPRTANSQMVGGLIWGLSSALHEATEVDPRAARYVNDSLAEYLVPVHADIGEVRAIMLDEEDGAVNPLGIKGIGELGTSGVNAAVANAVHHATGVRVRDLPIRVEKLLASPFLA